MTSQAKKERIDYRVTPEQKELIQRAASLIGRSTTDFAVSSLQEAATKIIREHEIISLSMRDQKDFHRALISSSKPSDRLLKAKKNYDIKI